MLRSDLGRFRLISLIEGISYLVLLSIAMPLKYVAGNTVAVPWAGRVHGGLFVLFGIALFAVATNRGWTWRKSAVAFISSLIPLGAFWLERRLRREYAD